MKANTYLVLFLLVALLSTCQKKSEKLDLAGHWHVYNPDSTFNTWDIIDSTELIFNKNNYCWSYPASFYLSEKDTTIKVLFNYIDGEYKYKYANDTLSILYDEVELIGDTTYITHPGKIIAYAVRVDTTTCDLSEEYYGHLDIEISLPTSQKVNSLNDSIANKGLVSYMDIGTPKSFIQGFPKDTFLVQVNDTFITYHSVIEYIEQERSKLPEVDRDSLKLLMGINKNVPAIVVDSIEQLINSSYPTVDIYYACLQERKIDTKKTIFSAFKNEFRNPVGQPIAYLIFSINANGEIFWTLQQADQPKGRQRYSLQSMADKKKLKDVILHAKQTKRNLGITFDFQKGITFQDYINAQEAIKRAVEEITP